MSSIVSFHGVAVERIEVGAAVQIEMNTETGRMMVRPLRPEDLRATVETEVAAMTKCLECGCICRLVGPGATLADHGCPKFQP